MASKKTPKRSENKAASIYDVARESRVSVFTVSAVVNKKAHVGKKLRERVEAAIRKLSYRPNLLARSLAVQPSPSANVAVSGRDVRDVRIDMPPLKEVRGRVMVRGAEDAAQKQGYNLLLCNSDDNAEKEASVLELLLSKRVDGILLTKAVGDFSPSLQRMIDMVNTPFVLIMRTCPKLTRDAVITDDYKGAYEAVCHLARAGRKRIGLIGGPLRVSNGKARWQGFRDALAASSLEYDPGLVIEGDYRIESGYRAGHLLLSHRPEGIYVANYLMTVGLLKAAEEMGLSRGTSTSAGQRSNCHSGVTRAPLFPQAPSS